MNLVTYIIDACESYIVHLQDFYNARSKTIDLKRKIKIADERFRGTGRQHHVIEDSNGKYVVVNRKDILFLRINGHIRRNITMFDITRSAAYSTPSKIIQGLTGKIYGKSLVRK